MSMSWFLDEIERRLEDERQSRRELESEVARLSQMLDKVASMAGSPRSGGTGNLFVGKATSAISARSGTTPGSGTVEIYDATSGTLTATGATHTAKNAGAAISSGKYVMGWTDKFGVKWVDPEECE